jgi:hypothetical protein
VNAPLSLPELRSACTPLDAALAYLEAGFRIVGLHNVTPDGACTCQEGARCRRRGKHPRADFYKRAGLDWKAGLTKAQATELWKRYPQANLGLATGGAARLVALDIDGEDGRAQLAAFEKAHGPLPTTATACTGSGGEHRLFICPAHLGLAALSNRVGVQGRGAGGLDVRVEGGQIVAAPSMHPSGRRYEWTHRGPIAELPEALYRLLTEARQEDSQGGAGTPPPTLNALPVEPIRISNSRPVNRPDAFERARMWLAAQPPAIEAQGGSKTLFRVAVGLVRGFGLSDDQALQLIWSEYNPRCQPPWDREAKDGPVHKVRDAQQRGQMPFGQLLEQEGTWRAPPMHDSQGPRPTVPTVSNQPSPPPVDLSDAWPSLASLVGRLRDAPAKLPTGLEPIDMGWRGGAPAGLLWVIGGAPGAGKTTFAVHLAHAWAQQGIPVGYIAGDEPREGVLIRLGQQIGLDRTFLEEGRPVPLGDLEKHLATLPLLLVDPDDDPGVEVESVAAALRRRWGEGPAVLVIDSLQSMARRIPADVVETPRSKVDAFLKGCKAAAKRHGIVLLCLSELARGAYSGGPMATNDLAAAKESGAIEYEAGALCVLRSVEDEPGLVSVTWAKSRPGRVEPFGLMINHRSATVEVTKAPAKKKNAAPEETHRDLLGLVVELLRREPGLAGLDAVRARLGRRREEVREAVKELLATGVLENRGSPSRPRLFWVCTNPSGGEPGGGSEASEGGSRPNPPQPAPNPPQTRPGRVSTN